MVLLEFNDTFSHGYIFTRLFDVILRSGCNICNMRFDNNNSREKRELKNIIMYSFFSFSSSPFLIGLKIASFV